MEAFKLPLYKRLHAGYFSADRRSFFPQPLAAYNGKSLFMKPLRIPLRVVLYKDEQSWVAHCLEFDLMGDGPTKQDAMAQLGESIKLQVEASLEVDNAANLFKPADGRFFQMFAAGKDVVVGELRVHLDSVIINEAETREYVDANADEIELVGA